MWYRNKASGKISSVLSASFGIALLLLSFLIWQNKQLVSDVIANWQYQPTPEIVALAERTTMTDAGKFYFYATKPILEGTQTFNKECERKEANSAILGCYTGTGIYLYNIADPKLDGIKEVTAAHEMLHSVYDRLSQSEKDALRPLFQAEYEKRRNDKELADRMAFYERNEAGEQDNELHSIIGTEFKTIDPKLEEHYAKYFYERSVIVDLYMKYKSVFNELKSRADSLANELKLLAAEIETASESYNSAIKTLNADISAFNKRATTGDFVSKDAFNRERSVLVERINAISRTRAAIEKDIEEYETLRTQYNQVADASQKLYESIDSKLAPAPAI